MLIYHYDLAVCIKYTDGNVYSNCTERYNPFDTLTELLALQLTYREIIDSVKSRVTDSICILWCKKYDWDRTKEEDIIKRKYYSIEQIKEEIALFNIWKYIPKITTSVLEILPDYTYLQNHSLEKKVEKLRVQCKCTDWTKIDWNTECDNGCWWYLDGELEHRIGYDKGYIINATKAGVTKDAIRYREIQGNKCIEYEDVPFKKICLNGIAKCKIIGVREVCIGFFYTDDHKVVSYDKGFFNYWNQRGYVVMKKDTYSVIHAFLGMLMKHLN